MKINKRNNSLLTEAWSPSMPLWLKNYMVKYSIDKKYGGYGNYQAKQNARQKAIDQGYNPNVSDPYHGQRSPDTRGTYKRFYDANINLGEANFISGPVPTSSRDPRLSEPNLAIYHLVDPGRVDVVYATGLNDKDQIPIDGKWMQLGSIPFKRLQPYIADFCYIDTTDKNNYFDAKSRQERQAEIRQGVDYERYKDPRVVAYGRNIKLDKSGYIKDPQKYVDKLKELQKKDPAKALEKAYNRLRNIKEIFISIMTELPLSDPNEVDNSLRAVRDLKSYMSSAVSSYNSLLNGLDSISNLSEEEKQKKIDQWFHPHYSTYSDLIYNLDRLDNSLKEYTYAVADWDNPEITESLDEVKQNEVFHNNNGIDYDVIERSRTGKNALLKDGKQWVIAWNCPKDGGSWGQGHYFFDEESARKVWETKYLVESIIEDKIIIDKKDYLSKNQDLLDKGYKVIWSGNGKICFAKYKQ